MNIILTPNEVKVIDDAIKYHLAWTCNNIGATEIQASDHDLSAGRLKSLQAWRAERDAMRSILHKLDQNSS